MMLVDTSVWVDHFRRSVPELARRLHDGDVACHPFVTGELALGGLRRPVETLALFSELPHLGVMVHDDVLRFVLQHRLAGSGLGWVDAHLLCAAATWRALLWTRDRKLRAAAARLGVSADLN